MIMDTVIAEFTKFHFNSRLPRKIGGILASPTKLFSSTFHSFVEQYNNIFYFKD